MTNKRRVSGENTRNLIIQAAGERALSRTQIEFNRLMKNLEAARAKHSNEEAKLDSILVTASKELMPLVEQLKRVNRDLVFSGFRAMDLVKLTAKRHHWFGDLLAGKAAELIEDPAGLSDKDVEQLERIVQALFPEDDSQGLHEEKAEEFDFLRQELENVARAAGVDLDLSGLDPNGDPEEFERLLRERLDGAAASTSSKEIPRPSKAQRKKEQKLREQEEAKNKDIKSLFKQLAKAFHPDLEPDPVSRAHKEVWMQRLNAAYATNDLREMLQLEMEWLGEEATNLANASDEKLKVYCAVLKEQVSQQKLKTYRLIYESQYGLLQRFIHPFFGSMSPPEQIKSNYRAEIANHQEMLEVLEANNIHTRKMMAQWADTNYENSRTPF
jgi:hypothetical protein